MRNVVAVLVFFSLLCAAMWHHLESKRAEAFRKADLAELDALNAITIAGEERVNLYNDRGELVSAPVADVPRLVDEYGFVLTTESSRIKDRAPSLLSINAFGAASVLSAYFLIGWYVYSLLMAVLRRYLAPKWAFLCALVVCSVTLNAAGLLRSLVGICKLPSVA